jgi:hypothetical protein
MSRPDQMQGAEPNSSTSQNMHNASHTGGDHGTDLHGSNMIEASNT